MERDYILLDEAGDYSNYPYSMEVYKIIGACMEVHKYLGKGFKEVVYKDALEYEFKLLDIPYVREQPFYIPYKDIVLKRIFYADFYCYGAIVVEAKAKEGVIHEMYTQTINYLAASKQPLGLFVNFGENSLAFRRIILTK